MYYGVLLSILPCLILFILFHAIVSSTGILISSTLYISLALHFWRWCSMSSHQTNQLCHLRAQIIELLLSLPILVVDHLSSPCIPRMVLWP